MTLVVVCIEKLFARCACQHCREFPDQIVDVLDAGVKPKTAGGRHLMGGITGKKDAATAILGGNVGRCGPWDDAEDFNVDIRYTYGKPNELGRALGSKTLHLIPVSR